MNTANLDILLISLQFFACYIVGKWRYRAWLMFLITCWEKIITVIYFFLCHHDHKVGYFNLSRNQHKHTYRHTNTDSWTCVLLSERVLRQRVSQLLLGCWVSEETIIRAEKATALKWLQGEKKRERERDEKRRIETKIPDIEPIHFLKMPLRGYSRELESEARAIPTRREREREKEMEG